jgi:hypothetical protein
MEQLAQTKDVIGIPAFWFLASHGHIKGQECFRRPVASRQGTMEGVVMKQAVLEGQTGPDNRAHGVQGKLAVTLASE